MLDDLLALLELALLHDAFGLHVGHVPPGAGVPRFQGDLRRGRSVAGRQRVVPEVPCLPRVKAGKYVLGIADGHRLAPGFQGFGCQLEPAGKFFDDLGSGFAAAGLQQ